MRTHISAEDERNFDYIEGSKKGPAFWGDIKRERAACKNGRLQSPIDLSSLKVITIPSLVGLKTTYKRSNATLKNRGHAIKSLPIIVKLSIKFNNELPGLEWAGYSGSIEINGIEFTSNKVTGTHPPSIPSMEGGMPWSSTWFIKARIRKWKTSCWCPLPDWSPKCLPF
ncbi:hypothetical protein C1H46_006524 [Malus baccata]|uniref:Uncharacterized protein n=1 Tax=Malus baccata TaxID=106549 RepID=A0A540NA15_MALBA|nr:hypothetical protein C1H46_006524 [Malus baccata]